MTNLEAENAIADGRGFNIRTSAVPAAREFLERRAFRATFTRDNNGFTAVTFKYAAVSESAEYVLNESGFKTYC